MGVEEVVPPTEFVGWSSSGSGFKILISTKRRSGEVRTTVVVGSEAASGSQRMDSRREIDIEVGMIWVGRRCRAMRVVRSKL